MAIWSKYLNPNLDANLRNTLYLELELLEVSQDKINNKSTVKVSARVKGNGWGTYNYVPTSGVIKITDNPDIPFNLPSYTFNSGTNVLLKEATVTIPHNSDGKKTVTASVEYNGENAPWVGSATVSGSLPLTTIPRASSFTANNLNAGASGILITLTKSPAATTHKAKVMFGTTVICEKDIGANPTSIPLTEAEWNTFYNLTKDVASGTLNIILTTYNGTTSLGSETKTVTATYPTTDIPTLTGITIADQNATVNSVIGATNFLQLLSQIKLTIAGATGVKSSTITDYEIKIDTSIFTTNNPIWIPSKSGTFTASARVKDSRGRWSASKTLAIIILPYSRPSIGGTSARRSDSAGALALLGTYARVQFSASVASVLIGGVQKNTLRYKIDDVTNMSSPIAKVGNTNHSGLTASNLFKVLSSYPISDTARFLITITDIFGQTAPGLVNLPVAETPMTWGKKGIAIGGIYNKNGKPAQFYGGAEVIGERLYVDGYDNTTYPLGIYHYSSGVLIDTGLVSTTTSHMCLLRIYGNSYGNLDPIDTLLQFYWYYNETTGVYSFTNAAQRNLGHELGQIKLMIINGKVHIWIPPLASSAYVTLKLELYNWNGTTVPITATNSAEPSTGVTYKTGAAIRTDKYVPPANTPADFNSWFDGRFPSILNSVLNGTKGSSGYQRLPNGMILQYGRFTYAAGALNSTITFPIAFPNMCIAVNGNAWITKSGFNIGATDASNWAAWVVSFFNLAKSNVVCMARAGDDNSASGSAMVIIWMAIGY